MRRRNMRETRRCQNGEKPVTRLAAAVALALVLAAITAGAAWTPPQPNPPPETGIQR